MIFRRHAVLSLSVLAIATIATVTAITSQLFSALTTSVEAGQFELMEATVESKLRNTEGRAHSRAAMIANSPTTRRLFAARDRDGLYEEHRAMWEVQRDQFGAAMMQFHIAPAISFLRMHHPEDFGDDLSGYRPMVVAVNQDHAPRTGAYIGRSGPAITGVVPVNGPDGTPIGTFEVGLDFGPALDDLKESFGLEATFLVLEEPLREVSTSVPASALDPQFRVGSYMKWYSTNWELARQLATASDLERAGSEVVRYTREVGGAPWGVLLHPIHDAAGEPLGVILVARDFSATRAAAGRTLVWQLLLALFASVVLVGGITVVIRGFLLRPLDAVSQRFGDLSRGRRDLVIADPARLPRELAELASHHEKLRTEGIPHAPGEEPKDGA